ncbi:MAG: M48 family metallopeptidase [Cyanobacteria bacterium P01_D01_bin.105]
MKNFFEHQDQARRTTAYLVFLFVCAIVTTIIALYIACIMAVMKPGDSFWQPGWLITITVGTCAIIGFGSMHKMAALRGGGQVIATGLGGQLVRQDTANPEERELLNVVEEMAIAAGVAVPEVYLLPGSSINAFAAGLTPNNAVIGVTQGTLHQLHRNELQGVIGHEFSHIVNGDMALNLKLMGLIHGLFLIHLIGRELFFSRGHRRAFSKNKGAAFSIAFAMMAIGAIGWVFGQLIKSAVSRQREYLADASAVQFTRDPHGITNALRRIAQQPVHSAQMRSAQAESASHLFFNNVSLLGAFVAPFSTHPPLAHRIRRLGGGSQSLSPSKQVSSAHRKASVANPNAQNHAPLASITHAMPIPGSSDETPLAQISSFAVAAATAGKAGIAPESVVSNIGTVTPAHLKQAHSILSHLPTEITKIVRSQPGAVAVVYGLLLDSDREVRSRQKRIILDSSQTVYALLEGIESRLDQLPVRSRLPLLEICIPTLKQLKPQVAAQCFKRIKALVKADGKLSLSEFALQTILQYRLAPHFRPEQAKKAQSTDIWPDSLIVLSALAKAGHTDRSHIDYAFRDGLQRLPRSAQKAIPTSVPSASLHDVSKALSRLRLTSPKLKQSIAEACAHTVLADQHTTDSEAELLRAILIALGCPVPPFLDTVTPNQVAAAA